MKKGKGFTLVEMLVVISILSVVGVLILTIFTNTLKGSNKSQIIGVIKQNGQSVLEQIDKTVRGADKVVCTSKALVTSVFHDTLVIVKNGVYTRYRFIVFTSSTNGLIQQDNPTKQIVRGTGKEETDSVFKTSVCDTGSLMPRTPGEQVTILSDTNPQTGVSVENYSFARDELDGFNDQVRIKFDLKPGVLVPQSIRDQIDIVTFQTTIQLR